MQEYDISESELRKLLSHIVTSEEKNALIFTYDVTDKESFRAYLKRAIKELIFSYGENESENIREKKAGNPFLIIGMKADQQGKVKKEEVYKLMEVLKKHFKCEVREVAARSMEDIQNVLQTLMCLAADMMFEEAGLSQKGKEIE